MTERFVGLKTESAIERNGIFVDKLIAETTVWDKLAKQNPMHAVISAGTEEDVAKKSADQIAELASELRGGVVLDLGCGYGRIAKYLLPKRSFTHYIGVDSAYQMLTLFKDRYESEGAEHATPVTFINADIHTLPLQAQTVDNVVVAAVFLHNHKSVVEKAIEEVHRVLKPEGKVFVYSSFPNKWSLMGLQGAVYQMFLNLTGNPFKNGPVRYYGAHEVATLFAYFSSVDIRPSGFALLPKRLIFLPRVIGDWWRVGIANPINTFLARILPQSIVNRFPSHYDVIAQK